MRVCGWLMMRMREKRCLVLVCVCGWVFEEIRSFMREGGRSRVMTWGVIRLVL